LLGVGWVIMISADDARNDFGGGTAFAFETQDWWRSGRAQNLIRLIIKRDNVTVSPNAPQLESIAVAAPKPEEIKLGLAPGKIHRDRCGGPIASHPTPGMQMSGR
jgi:hypothetical protein